MLNQAQGIKTSKSTDIKLLKKTVKRKEIVKEKNQQEWKERIKQTDYEIASKQKKRTENIQKRIDLKKSKNKGGKGVGKKPKGFK